MRKALFALVMVLAAFAGGAAVNGPGLAWVRSTLSGVLRDRLSPAGPGEPRPGPVSAGIASLPDPPRPPDPPKSIAPTPPGPETASAGLSPPAPVPSTAIEVASPPPRSETPPLDLAMPDPGPTPTPAPPTEPASAPKVDPVVLPATGPGGPRDWSDLRRRFRELGVTRYELEGETDGRSRFRCLIPLAGRRAVGQQFEGEGDDDFQAAEAALRRVALWRATETAPR